MDDRDEKPVCSFFLGEERSRCVSDANVELLMEMLMMMRVSIAGEDGKGGGGMEEDRR